VGRIVVTPPNVEPVTLDQVRNHLNLSHDFDDDLLSLYVETARSTLEAETGRALLTQVWDVTFDAFPPCQVSHPDPVTWRILSGIRLPGGRCQSVDSISYIDENGAPQTLAAEDYQVDLSNLQGADIVPASDGEGWPAIKGDVINPVTVRATFGWQSAPEVPGALRQAVLWMIAHQYEHREAVIAGSAVAEIPGLQQIINGWRVWRWGA
jgi:uncharacterized phiE125 gp8 family phage protein